MYVKTNERTKEKERNNEIALLQQQANVKVKQKEDNRVNSDIKSENDQLKKRLSELLVQPESAKMNISLKRER